MALVVNCFIERVNDAPERRLSLYRTAFSIAHGKLPMPAWRHALIKGYGPPAIENDRVSLGVERAWTLAKTLKCHPAVLLFPGWDVDVESAA